MTVLSSQSIRRVKPIFPFHERTKHNGLTYGLGPASYDVRIDQDLILPPFGLMRLASTIEHFKMPKDIIARVADKSTWIRKGVSVQNTVIDPGWCGYLTLEISNHSLWWRRIRAGSPIAQIVFEWLDFPTDTPYKGKYQNQPPEPVAARHES